MADYLKTQFNLYTFPLQKVQYYSYADYLKSVKRLVPVFSLTERAFNAIRLFGMIDL